MRLFQSISAGNVVSNSDSHFNNSPFLASSEIIGPWTIMHLDRISERSEVYNQVDIFCDKTNENSSTYREYNVRPNTKKTAELKGCNPHHLLCGLVSKDNSALVVMSNNNPKRPMTHLILFDKNNTKRSGVNPNDEENIRKTIEDAIKNLKGERSENTIKKSQHRAPKEREHRKTVEKISVLLVGNSINQFQTIIDICNREDIECYEIDRFKEGSEKIGVAVAMKGSMKDDAEIRVMTFRYNGDLAYFSEYPHTDIPAPMCNPEASKKQSGFVKAVLTLERMEKLKSFYTKLSPSQDRIRTTLEEGMNIVDREIKKYECFKGWNKKEEKELNEKIKEKMEQYLKLMAPRIKEDEKSLNKIRENKQRLRLTENEEQIKKIRESIDQGLELMGKRMEEEKKFMKEMMEGVEALKLTASEKDAEDATTISFKL